MENLKLVNPASLRAELDPASYLLFECKNVRHPDGSLWCNRLVSEAVKPYSDRPEVPWPDGCPTE